MSTNRKIMTVLVFTALFFLGILLILKSNVWGLADFGSMNLAGAIISAFSGVGILCELYSNNKR